MCKLNNHGSYYPLSNITDLTEGAEGMCCAVNKKIWLWERLCMILIEHVAYKTLDIHIRRTVDYRLILQISSCSYIALEKRSVSKTGDEKHFYTL